MTEVACIYGVNDKAIPTTVKFINDLLWYDTDISSIKNCNNPTLPNIPDKLPGLRTNNKFLYKDKNLSWYEQGFGAITWFTSNTFAGFETGCGNDFSQWLNSNIWTDGKLNDIYNAFV